MNSYNDGGDKSIKQRFRDIIQAIYYNIQLAIQVKSYAKLPPALPGGIVIVPADVQSPLGSRGDEAMLQAIIDGIRESDQDVRIGLISSVNCLDSHFTHNNLELIDKWPSPWSIKKALSALQEYDRLVFLGADMMDGYYNSGSSLRRWLLAKAFVRRNNCRAAFMGFSFNEKVPQAIKNELSKESVDNIIINIRDPASYRRFKAISPKSAQQVADVAFLLKPAAGEKTEKITAWIKEQKIKKRIVCGINIHPMLSINRNKDEINILIKNLSYVIKKILSSYSVSFILVPHDYRGGESGDVNILQELYQGFNNSDYVFFQDQSLAANEIKFIASQLDCLLTGRMHLAIAALGSGVPVGCITYTDKFDGLYELIGLPNELLIKSSKSFDLQERDFLLYFLLNLIEKRNIYKNKVVDKLDHIKKLSYLNIKGVV